MEALREPRRAATLSAQAADQLREQIASGRWPVGSRIPPEHELVAILGISRNTVREALRALVHLGLLEARAGDGTYVRVASELEAVLVRRAATAHLSDVFELRAVLEEHAAGLAAQRRTSADVKRLRELLHKAQETNCAGEMTALADVDGSFHLAVVEAGGNGLLAEVYKHLGSGLAAVVAGLTWGRDIAAEHDHWHTALVEAIAAGDAVTARSAASTLVRISRRAALGQEGVHERDCPERR
ncbi:FadR/GntR family transcriptional regulator [Streptomyces sp. NPDC058316]|uniref:FadR/GntR family transcriptional regulator n=1 Tax=unclassified Streptomyces TaxID=2593676 RepID=UPI0033250AA2